MAFLEISPKRSAASAPTPPKLPCPRDGNMLHSIGRRSCAAALSTLRQTRAMSSLGTLYSAPGTPSPDTVHFYLHEAGIADSVAVEKVNIGKAANRSDEKDGWRWGGTGGGGMLWSGVGTVRV